jgi:hypothetical protein
MAWLEPFLLSLLTTRYLSNKCTQYFGFVKSKCRKTFYSSYFLIKNFLDSPGFEFTQL